MYAKAHKHTVKAHVHVYVQLLCCPLPRRLSPIEHSLNVMNCHYGSYHFQ